MDRGLDARPEAGVQPENENTGSDEGAEAADRVAGGSADSAATFAYQPNAHGARLFRIELTSGVHTLAATLEPNERSGLVSVNSVVVAADSGHFVYLTIRQLSQLFVVSLAGR